MNEKITKHLQEAARTAGTGNVKNAISNLIEAIKVVRDEALSSIKEENKMSLTEMFKDFSTNVPMPKPKAYFPEIDDEGSPEAYLDRYMARKFNLDEVKAQIAEIEKALAPFKEIEKTLKGLEKTVAEIEKAVKPVAVKKVTKKVEPKPEQPNE